MSSREQFDAWFYAPEREELRKGCAPGWAFLIWQAATASTQEQMAALAAELKDISSCCSDLTAENVQQVAMLRKLLDARPGGVYFNKFENEVKSVLNDNVATDAFIAEQQAIGVEKLAALAGNECKRYKSVNDRVGFRKWKSIVILCSDFARLLRDEVKS